MKLIWLDLNINNDENIEYQKEISEMGFLNTSYLDNVDDFMLELSQSVSCVVIISGSVGEILIPKVHDFKCIKQVLILCYDVLKH